MMPVHYLLDTALANNKEEGVFFFNRMHSKTLPSLKYKRCSVSKGTRDQWSYDLRPATNEYAPYSTAVATATAAATTTLSPRLLHTHTHTHTPRARDPRCGSDAFIRIS